MSERPIPPEDRPTLKVLVDCPECHGGAKETIYHSPFTGTDWIVPCFCCKGEDKSRVHPMIALEWRRRKQA